MRRSIDAVSVLSDDLAEYDIISDGQRSLESSITDLGQGYGHNGRIREPPPTQEARELFRTASSSAEEIQDYVQRGLGGRRIKEGVARVYVDGFWDKLQTRDFLQLRQAKLSLPYVHLMVGVFPDELCDSHQSSTWRPHVDRCEAVRHCRWVDEVVPDAPWRLDEAFLRGKKIDYVAIDEGSSVDPACDKERVVGYDVVKKLGKAIPTRRAAMVARPETRQDAGDMPPVVESAKSTIRGIPPHLKEAETPRLSSQKFELRDEKSVDESPFEEPKVDEFEDHLKVDSDSEFGEPKVDEFGAGL